MKYRQILKKEWNKWLSGISSISDFEFPQCIVKDDTYKHAKMHLFADSSHEAYAVTCFGRFEYNDNTVSVVFLFGKCKVCPMGGALTIPRLELVAAALATRIANSMLQESNIKYERIVYWSDSLATLHLIHNNTRRFCVFVDSRLAEIRESSCVTDWKYCPTNLNLSVVGTRLIGPKNRKKFLPWVKGPGFIILPEQE